MTKVSDTWELLNERLNLEEMIELNQIWQVTAEDFHKINVQPRLNTKFDSRKNLPELFVRNNWGILPNSRNSYVVGKFNIFCDVVLPNDLEKVNAKELIPHTNLQSLKSDDVYSEASALNLLYSSGALKQLIGSDSLPTVSGRMGSGEFEFNINSSREQHAALSISNNKSTMEIDAGFETSDSLILFEAKNIFIEDFNIRQLYFPFRKWERQISKTVRPFLLLKQEDIFFVTEYSFEEPSNFSSIKAKTKHVFRIGPFRFDTKQIREIIEAGPRARVSEKVPFPQADNVANFQRLLEILANGPMNKSEIAEALEFDERQSDYYSNALRFLCLTAKSAPGEVALSALGESYLTATELERNAILIGQMSQLKSFTWLASQDATKSDAKASDEFRDKVLEDFEEFFGQKPEASTLFRRSQTVAAWVSWLRSIGG